MNKLKALVIGVFSVIILGVATVSVVAEPVSAQVNVFPQCGAGVTSEVCSGGGTLFGPGSIWNRILNTLTYIVGAASVLMIIIGGLRYTLSAGDSNSAAGAKNTIIFAVVGLVLAVMANALVNFVLTNI